MSNAVQKIEPQDQMPATSNESGAILSLVQRAASDPNCDIDKMERLMKMHTDMQARQAEAAFAAAMSDMQDELPVIAERGNANGRYTYALWEDINAKIKPVLKRYGFALSFRTDTKDGITVIGILKHRDGHSEETSITLDPDTSGNKPGVQAVASAVSYGKRYAAGALLNLTSHGEDDDAYAAAVEYITDEQAATIADMIEATGSDKKLFLEWLKARSIAEIPAKHYDTAIRALKAKAK